jgi:diguanylate cyclase (GGDEF)-like protein
MAGPPLRILLVEDDPEDALLLRRLLENSAGEKFELQHVTTAAAAVACLEQHEKDLLLLDLGLPDSQGFDTVIRFRTLFPSLPMVIVSGTDDELIGIQAVECGAQDYVAKGLVAGQLLTRAIRFAIARHSQITSFKTAAHTDSLTGLPNRRAFDAELAKQLSERARVDGSLSLMLLDIDHFKRLNDTYGHRAGDYVLCQFGSILTRSLRESDFPARYGGEEFGIILPRTDLDQAKPAATRLVSTLHQMTFQFEGRVIHVTASAGLAQAGQRDLPGTLLERADAALYAAKDAGRNRCYLHDGQSCRKVETG